MLARGPLPAAGPPAAPGPAWANGRGPPRGRADAGPGMQVVYANETRGRSPSRHRPLRPTAARRAEGGPSAPTARRYANQHAKQRGGAMAQRRGRRAGLAVQRGGGEAGLAMQMRGGSFM